MLGTIVPSAFDATRYIPELKLRRKESVLQELVNCAHRAGSLCRPELVLEQLLRRESLGSTAPGRAFAIPNVRTLLISEPRVVVARSRRGIDWGAADEVAVQLVFLALSPAECPEAAHFDLLARIAGVARLQRNRQKMLEAESFDPIATLLRDEMP